MRLGIMQPYFFPYIGYFQLMASVNKFVLLDDVNYIKGGWINRNKILIDRQSKWITVPLQKASPNKLIKDINLKTEFSYLQKLLRTIKSAYSKAPYFSKTYELVEEIISLSDCNLSSFLYKSLQLINNYLEIDTVIEPTSSIYPKNNLKGQDRILDICLKEEAKYYINPPGGKNLYDQLLFQASGINLHFLEPVIFPYNQNINEFIPSLSIIDVLMWNSLENVQSMVKQYQLSK